MSNAAESRCCSEYGCLRKKPYRIRLGPFSQRWMLITDYTTREPNLLVASRKHDIHDELVAALLDAGWRPPEPNEELAECESCGSKEWFVDGDCTRCG